MFNFEELRKKYKYFIYKDFTIQNLENTYQVIYYFSIPELCEFESVWEFPIKSRVNETILRRLFFNLGMVETISYWKCVCPQSLIVQCGEMTKEQCAWWEKLFYNGLGEFLYRNDINISQEELLRIDCKEADILPMNDERIYTGCLIPIGGGKDSIVSLELLKKEYITTYCVNGNETTSNIIRLCNYKKNDYVAKRMLDSKLLELNKLGYLNGHIPFSAVVAFSSVIAAFLCGNKYIVLSNETSANETTVRNSFVNHQYSKSFEFEMDFMWYIKSLVNSDIHCPKCLFVYIILLPFLDSEKLTDIFGENLLDKKSLDLYFRELIGVEENKPFECVGTRREVLVALKSYIDKGGKSLLTDRYLDVIADEADNIQDMLNEWVNENNVPEAYKKILERYMEQ